MDEHFQPENLLQATQAVLFKSTITSVNGWWPSFGAELTNLLLSSCEIALPVLLGMLRHTPNLTNLSPGSINYASVEEVEIDFRLEKLEHLDCDEVFDIYERIFPRLRKLELAYELEDEESVCRLLQSVQETLKVLVCDLSPFMLEQLASMDRLRLTEAVVPVADGDEVVRLSRIQPTIEKLRATASNEVRRVSISIASICIISSVSTGSLQNRTEPNQAEGNLGRSGRARRSGAHVPGRNASADVATSRRTGGDRFELETLQKCQFDQLEV